MTAVRYCDRCRRTHIVPTYVEPEVPYDPRIPTVRLLNIVLSVLFLEAMVAAWALPHLYRWVSL